MPKLKANSTIFGDYQGRTGGVRAGLIHAGEIFDATDEQAESLEARGLKFLLSKQTSEIVGGESGRVCALRFKDGETIPADLVVMAVGVRPNTELAEKARLHCNRGIVVSDTMQTFDPRIYAVVSRIPKGRVATYGQIALLAGLPRQARLVGYAMHSLPADSDVPWHRVVNAAGKISIRADGLGHDELQAQLLRREGVRFVDGAIPLARYLWQPRQRRQR